MAKFFALSFLLQSCFVVQGQQYGSNVPAIQKQMLAAMDTCIEYMTAALICHPPKRKLEKVNYRVIWTPDSGLTVYKCIFSTIIDLVAFSSMQFTIKLLENVKIVAAGNHQHEIDGNWLISIPNSMPWTMSGIQWLLSIRKLKMLMIITMPIPTTMNMLHPMMVKLNKESPREAKFLHWKEGVRNNLWIHWHQNNSKAAKRSDRGPSEQLIWFEILKSCVEDAILILTKHYLRCKYPPSQLKINSISTYFLHSNQAKKLISDMLNIDTHMNRINR